MDDKGTLYKMLKNDIQSAIDMDNHSRAQVILLFVIASALVDIGETLLAIYNQPNK